MKVLITGINGFIGKNLAEYLSCQGIDVIGIYRTNKPVGLNCKLIKVDLWRDNLQSILNGESIDAVVHLAGQMRGIYAQEYLENTVCATQKLIKYAEENKITTFIYASSISTYGNTFGEVNESSDRINLDDYGMSKYFCERLLEDSKIKKRYVIRLPRTLGKYCDLTYQWIPKLTDDLLNNKDIYYMNPDLEYNNMAYIKDVEDFINKLLLSQQEEFQSFVLGAGDKKTILEIIKRIKDLTESTSRLIEKSSEGRNKCYSIDISKAKKYGFNGRSVEDILYNFVRDIKE